MTCTFSLKTPVFLPGRAPLHHGLSDREKGPVVGKKERTERREENPYDPLLGAPSLADTCFLSPRLHWLVIWLSAQAGEPLSTKALTALL